MFDVDWKELLLIGAVAVIVIGPKDLPVAIKTVAGWVKKAREMAGEFQRGVDEMVREAELADVRKQVEQAATSVVDDVQKVAAGAVEEVKQTVDPTGELEKSIQQLPEALNAPSGLETPSLEPLGPPAPATLAPVDTATVENPAVDIPASAQPEPTLPAAATEQSKTASGA
jgi:sec-independent protein translocase protein TatB